jgi:Stress responsive A/B Barrel Domain
MFRHVVLLRFTPESTPDQHEAVVTALRTLPARLDVLRHYDVALDAGLAEGNWHASAQADFDDADGWRTYTDDPEHQRIIAELIKPILAERAAVQLDL